MGDANVIKNWDPHGYGSMGHANVIKNWDPHGHGSMRHANVINELIIMLSHMDV